jgi:type IV pilus assembly protein PilX
VSITYRQPLQGQRGIALITALLLLLIITLLGLSMFRSFPTQERIAGNVREKERALHAATSAQQFAEWWLVNNVSTGDVVCAVQAQLLNANTPVPEGQICSNALYTLPPQPPGLVPSVTNVPWGGGLIGTQYIPVGMTITGNPIATAGDQTYASAPVFYIADLGAAGDAAGEAYQIDAYAYGGSTNTVAVVESIYEVQQGVVNRTGE